jgi:AraC-like DNA-binding protein
MPATETPDSYDADLPDGATRDLIMRRWSTNFVPAEQAFDYYASSMQQALVPMSLQCRSRVDFHAMAEATDLGQLELLRMVGNAHRVARGPSEIARSERHLYHLFINRLAPWRLVHRGASQIRAGDAVLLDSAQPHELEVDAYELINVTMPVQFVEQWLPEPSRLAGRPLARFAGRSAPLASFVSQLTPEFVIGRCPLPEHALAEQIGALLMLAASELELDESAPRASERTLHSRIVDLLHQRFAETELAPSDIAHSLGVDERTLHSVLALHGETFTTLLLRHRIHEADRIESSSHGRDLAPDALARSAGFRDARRLASARRNQTGLR